MWEKLRARDQTILLFSRGFDIGDLDVEILFERQMNSSGKCQLLAAGSSILGHCGLDLRPEDEKQECRPDYSCHKPLPAVVLGF
jgi:hypothetical protein